MTHYSRLKTFALAVTLLCAAAVTPPKATATPVEVGYNITGAPGNWTLDFTFKNNMHYANSPNSSPPIVQDAPGDMNLYEVGVRLSARDIVGSPARYDPTIHTSENLSFLTGASGTTYNDVWQYFNPGHLAAQPLFPQVTLSGFLVHVTDQTAPLSTAWFAVGSSNDIDGSGGFHTGGRYIGGGNFNSSGGPRGGTSTPGFEGLAQGTIVTVPESSSLLLLGIALGGLAMWRWKQAA